MWPDLGRGVARGPHRLLAVGANWRARPARDLNAQGPSFVELRTVSVFRPLLLAALSTALVLLMLPAPAAAGTPHKLPKKFRHSPYTLMSLSVGYPNDGWQRRAKKLRNRSYLHVKASSRHHNYGHPALVLMLERSAHDIARVVHGSVMVVGDLSKKHGGHLYGHHSHQSGRDADVAFYMRDKDGKLYVPDHFIAFDGEGKAKDGSGLVFDDYRNWLLLQDWVRDKRAGLAHVFISTPLKLRLIRYARRHKNFRRYVDEALKLLEQPEHAEIHDDHFHVRISCPHHQSEICHEESRPRHHH